MVPTSTNAVGNSGERVLRAGQPQKDQVKMVAAVDQVRDPVSVGTACKSGFESKSGSPVG